jgi:hypothetical protein
VLESQQAVLTADLQVSDLTTELNDRLGLPLNTRLELDAPVPASFDQARARSMSSRRGRQTRKYWQPRRPSGRRAGVTLAKTAYVPDIGRRRVAVHEREAQLAQAEENLQRLKEGVAVGIERRYHKVQQTRSLVQVANQV